MRQITSTTVTSGAPPATFTDRWARHRRRDGSLVERQWLFCASVRTTFRVEPATDPTAAGGSTITADLAIAGVLQGVWTLMLGERLAAGFPGYVKRQVAAAEAEAADPGAGGR